MTTRGQARNAFPAMRIFVFGQEVTEDVTSCSVNWADDTRAPNTSTFTLANPLGRYTVEEEDIFALYPNDLDPVLVTLPSLEKMLANNSAAQYARTAAQSARTRDGQIRFIQDSISQGLTLESATALLDRGKSALQKFAEEEYLPAIASKEDDLRTQIRARVKTIRDPIKRRVLLAKFDKVQLIQQPDMSEVWTGSGALTEEQKRALGVEGVGRSQIISDPRRASFLKGEAARYDFFAKRPIFHSNDPVRIFWRDPFNATVWYYMFAGFVSDWTRGVSVNNVSTMTFHCEDVLRPFRYGRISTSPGLSDIRDLQQDEDFVVQTFFNDDFTKLTITELLYTLIFGPELPGTLDVLKHEGNITNEFVEHVQGAPDLTYERHSVNGSRTQSAPRYGIGAFNFERSATFLFGPTTSAPQASDDDPAASRELKQREVVLDGADALAVYQAVVDHQVNVDDLESLAVDDDAIVSRSALPRDPRTGEPTLESVITTIGENPHLYPVDAGRLIILAPASLGPNTNRGILEKDFKGPEGQTTFKTRLGIIYSVLERIEFSFYATPRGDILAEMPLYDFDPADFGEAQVNGARVLDATKSSGGSGPKSKSIGRRAAGPFAPHYRVALRDTMDTEQTFTDDKIRTQFTTTAHVIQGLRGTGTMTDLWFPPQVVTLRGLVPQFGVRSEQADPPTFIASPEAAQVYCHLKLNQWNSDALTSTVDMLPQLRLGPNRPIEVEEGAYIATLRSINRVLDWEGRDMTQQVGINYTRVWDGLTLKDKKTPVYVPLGGAASRPLNYAALFKDRDQAPPTSSKLRGNAEVAALETALKFITR